MTSIEHSVSPEEIMAWMDGELTTARSGFVKDHVESCVQCAEVMEGFRETSQALRRWSHSAMSPALESRIMAEAATAPVGSVTGRGKPWRKRSIWIFLGSGGVVAALASLTLAIAIFRPSYGKRYSSNQPMTSEFQTLMPGIVKRERYAAFADAKDKSSNPMIAHSASISIHVADCSKAREALDQILARYQGYAARLTVSTPPNAAHSVGASLQIPEPHMEAALVDLRTLGQVENESQSGEEVGQQHEDLEARLKTARDTEERFRSVLQQRTGSVADVLQVQEQIARVRGEIEQMEAEQKALEHRVAFATIDISLNEEARASVDAPGGDAGLQMHNAFVEGYRNAVGTLLGIVVFVEEYGLAILIWLVLLWVPAALVRRRYRKVRSGL